MGYLTVEWLDAVRVVVLDTDDLSTVTLCNSAIKDGVTTVVNLRSSKSFALGSGHRVEFDADLFNLLNSSAPITLTLASGPTFDYATAVVPPRIARLGSRYSF